MDDDAWVEQFENERRAGERSRNGGLLAPTDTRTEEETPENCQELLDFLEGWARTAGWSAVEGGMSGEQRRAVGRFAPRKKYSSLRAAEAFFDRKLSEAREYVGKIEGILKSLAARLDAATLRKAVPAEADVERIEELIAHYHDAVISARTCWLQDDLGAAAYARLAALATPADLQLPLYVDVRQARIAHEQEEQIERRSGGRTAALARIAAAIRLLEAPSPGVVLQIGGGVVVTLVQTDGPWYIVKYVPSEKGFPYAKPVRTGTAETLGGLTLASTVVTWWLLLGGARPTAATPAPSREEIAVAETGGEFDGASDVHP